MLGIAQAIIFYVVFLSMVMIMITALTFINNNKVVRQIMPSWKKLFPTVDLKQVLSSGATPYSNFMNIYNELLGKNLDEDKFEIEMREHFSKMQEENRELFERMNPR